METVDTTADVVVIGGGPGGISAALWSHELGLTTILIEKENELGGQLLYTFNPIANYLGLAEPNGRELMKHFEQSVERSGFRRLTGCEVTRVDPETKQLTLADGRGISWRALIIATGVRRRRLGVPGESEFTGKGVLESGVRDAKLVAGKHVMIVGGGDAAIENALLLSDSAASLKVVIRGTQPRARQEFLDAVAKKANIEVIRETSVTEIVGSSAVTGVRLQNPTDQWIEQVDALLIRIGVEPNSQLVQATLEVDDESYIKTNAVGETSITTVYAIGDVANPIAPTISAASGMGATAAKAVYRALYRQKAI